jgi:F-type H+-transporting ATPase subunit b
MLEILGKVGFDWQVALANFINFVIIFFVLKRFAFAPINKIIKERQDKINLGIENAEKAETELLMAKEVGEKEIFEARVKANELVGEAQQKGDSIVLSSQNEALSLKSSIIKDGEKQISQKKESMTKELETETANIIIDGIEKILKEKLTKEQQESYIRKALAN